MSGFKICLGSRSRVRRKGMRTKEITQIGTPSFELTPWNITLNLLRLFPVAQTEECYRADHAILQADSEVGLDLLLRGLR